MSNIVSALDGKVEVGEVSVQEMGLRGMITLRGDLSNADLQKVSKDLTGVRFPSQGEALASGDHGLAWMSPDELLVMVPHETVGSTLETIHKALSGKHYLAVDVSDARAMLRVEGPFAREVIAKLAPVDLHPDSFPVGRFRRSRLGQVAAAFWLSDEDTFDVICFRSVAEYTFDLLAASANAGPVGQL